MQSCIQICSVVLEFYEQKQLKSQTFTTSLCSPSLQIQTRMFVAFSLFEIENIFSVLPGLPDPEKVQICTIIPIRHPLTHFSYP